VAPPDEQRPKTSAAVIKHRSHDDYPSPLRPTRALSACPGGGAADYYTRGKRKTPNGSHLIDDDVKSISWLRSSPALRSRCCRLAAALCSSKSFIPSHFSAWRLSAVAVELQRDVRLRMSPALRPVGSSRCLVRSMNLDPGRFSSSFRSVSILLDVRSVCTMSRRKMRLGLKKTATFSTSFGTEKNRDLFSHFRIVNLVTREK
jgi:hypothetical protein